MSQQPLCTSQWLSPKFVSLLIFSQLEACFSGPVHSDLSSDTGEPFASLQTVKVAQKSNAVARRHDQRPAGEPDRDRDIYNLKDRESFHFGGSYLPADRFTTASIRIKETRSDKAHEGITEALEVPLKETFGQRMLRWGWHFSCSIKPNCISSFLFKHHSLENDWTNKY